MSAAMMCSAARVRHDANVLCGCDGVALPFASPADMRMKTSGMSSLVSTP
jgi:hypothetical protein